MLNYIVALNGRALGVKSSYTADTDFMFAAFSRAFDRYSLDRVPFCPDGGRVAWFDGSIVPEEAVNIGPSAHTLHYGTGVFEGVRAYASGAATAIFRLEDHLRRLISSADTYGLNIQYAIGDLADAVCKTLCANNLRSAYIRPLAFLGECNLALAPKSSCPTHVLIVARDQSSSRVNGKSVARATISRWEKASSRSLPPAVKACGHYTNSALALQDAVARGFDDAILLNMRGLVAGGTSANIFVVSEGRLITNGAQDDVLEGITRDSIISLAGDLGIQVDVRLLHCDDLLDATEVFFAGTAAEIKPIGEIDGRKFDAPGVLTSMLQQAYDVAVHGNDSLHLDWITRCP